MRALILCVVCSVTLAVAAPALANSPTQGAYSGSGANQLTQAQATAKTPTATSAGTLPFTGLSLPILAVIAATMIGAGVVVRRTTSTDDR